MKKLLMLILSLLAILVVLTVALYLYAFTKEGNAIIKPYVQKNLETQIGMPVDLQAFTLDAKRVDMRFVLNGQTQITTHTNYSLFNLAYDGTFHIFAKKLAYDTVTLGKIDIRGDFKGVETELSVTGAGEALDSDLSYSFSVIDGAVSKLILKMKEAPLGEILQLAGQPAFAEGKIDVAIDMPQIGESNAQGDADILLYDGEFNQALLKREYGVTLEGKNHLSANIDAKLSGNRLQASGKVESSLFDILLKDTLLNVETKALEGAYALDIKELRVVTKNQLSGPLSAQGKLARNAGQLDIDGESDSLGGVVRFHVDEGLHVQLERVDVEKVAQLAKQPRYATGHLSGTVVWPNFKEEKKHYDLSVSEGQLNRSLLNTKKVLIPEETTFSLVAKGEMDDKTVDSSVDLNSSLGTLVLPKLTYALQTKTLHSLYDLHLVDIQQFMTQKQAKTAMPLDAKGELAFKEGISISGVSHGLGKELRFTYSSKEAMLDAPELLVERVLAVAGLPLYAKGPLKANVTVNDLAKGVGEFTLESQQLVLQPKAMKEWVGKAKRQNVALKAKGSLKGKRVVANTTLQFPFGTVLLPNIDFNTETKGIQSPYSIDIPDLTQLEPLIDRKLYGPLKLEGKLETGRALKVEGQTTSLEGNIAYRLVGKKLYTTITKVPVSNVLGLLGHTQNILGNAVGKGEYNLASKSGTVDLDIDSFQIKPSTFTTVIKAFLGKDPSRVIYNSTKFHADLKKNTTAYSLHAKGNYSSLDIDDGMIDKRTKQNRATFVFVYGKHTIKGKIKGSINDPKVVLDTSSIIEHQLTKGKLGEKLNKALGGKAGSFFKGFSFGQ